MPKLALAQSLSNFKVVQAPRFMGSLLSVQYKKRVGDYQSENKNQNNKNGGEYNVL
jgi:hypothetical protein